MELKDFLLLLFDKKINRYPMIRESFLVCYSASEVLDILAITNYHCTRNELKRYVRYACSDKGVRIRSLGNPPWACPRNELADMIVYDQNLIQHHVVGQYQQWINMIFNASTHLTTILDISSSNSEFIFAITLSINARHTNISTGGYVSIHSRITSKINSIYFIDYQEEFTDRTSIEIFSLSDSIFTIQSDIENFCKFLVMPVDECQKWFIDQLSYNDPVQVGEHIGMIPVPQRLFDL